MFLIFKKLFYAFALNACFFLLLMIGLQNSSNESKVNLIIHESVKLPIGFVIGTSFISGSLLGSLITISFGKEK